MVRLISAADTYNIRHMVLRPNQPVEECRYPSDDEMTSFHIGKFLENSLVGIASFYEENSDRVNLNQPCRLRGMAVLPKYQRQGIGEEMIQYGLSVLKDREIENLWCNARENAFSFYKRMGFEFYSDLFEIDGIGPHKVMVNKIDDL